MATKDTVTGVPSGGSMDSGSIEPLGRSGKHHWKQSTITKPGLEDRGSVYFAAIEMTRMPMILADARQDDMPIVFANNAFLDLTGYEEKEILGRNCRFLQGAQTDPETVAALREAVRKVEPISTEILNYRRDGTPFWNGIFMGPVYDAEGKLLYFFASQLDVTRRRESEQQFRQAQKMEAIGQLTAGLAHDFNNLLHIINGSLERLSSKRHDDRIFEKYMSAATSAAERGAKLTHQLLAFARRGRLEPKETNLSELINSIAELLETSVGSKANLRLNLQRRLPLVNIDANNLEMAVLNVVVNARDASPEGGAITVATCERSFDEKNEVGLKAGTYAELSIRDEGTGMPAHVKARALEPFFTTKPKGQGTGLGLAMAHGFAQQSGGRLLIDTEEGHGTTITMLFPKFEKPIGEAEGTTQGYTPEAIDPSTQAPLILVVDDIPEAASLAQDILEDNGYRVVVAHSAEDALKRFIEANEANPEEGFKLVFSDVIMPGGDNGLVLAKNIRELAPDIPVLLTTGYNDEMSLKTEDTDNLDVIGKPYRQNELINRVQAALRQGARTGPRRETSDFGHAEE